MRKASTAGPRVAGRPAQRPARGTRSTSATSRTPTGIFRSSCAHGRRFG
jgi:hypothetical protein